MGNEYDAVIADLEAQKAEIELLIMGLRKRAGLSPEGGGPSGREIHSATFIGKTIPEAARFYLDMCHKRPQKTEDIAKALQKGGMTSKAANFESMLQTILRRTEIQTGEFMRTSSGEWILPEWVGKKPMPKAVRDKEDEAVAAAKPENGATEEESKKTAG